MWSQQQIYITFTQQCIVKIQHNSIRISHLLRRSFVHCYSVLRLIVSVSAFIDCSILRNGYFSCLRNSVEESRVFESISTKLVFVFKCVEVFIKCVVSKSFQQFRCTFGLIGVCIFCYSLYFLHFKCKRLFLYHCQIDGTDACANQIFCFVCLFLAIDERHTFNRIPNCV